MIFRVAVFGFLVSLIASRVEAQLVINEILASNVDTILDEDGDSSDWVEFKNIGILPLDTEGYSLSDGTNNPQWWRLPSVTIPPQGYLLVWCSGKDRNATEDEPEPEPEPVTGAAAHWPLDDGVGDVFANLSDANLDGFLDGASVEWVGVVANADGSGPPQDVAVRFSGTNSWIQTNYAGVGGSTPRTVAVWIKTTATNTHGIVGWGNSGSSGAKWHVRVNNSAGNGVVGALRTEVQGGQNVATTVISDGEWHHIACVFPDGASGVSEVLHYVDGRLDPRSGGGNQTVNTQAGGGASPVTIGARFQGASHNDFPGDIADVRIYDRAIGLAGIRAIMNGGDPPPGPPPPPRTRALHTDFKLDSSGEQVLLADPQGRVVDGIDYPSQVSDQSYGRSPDGGGQFFYHLIPSPLEANDGRTSILPLVVADTKFEPNRGFYDEPFSVEITTATPLAVIRYTFDGTEPTVTHGSIYSGPIPVSDTTTIRAAAFKSGLRPTDADAHTYLFLETPTGGGILNQPNRPAGWPATWGSRTADYEMDQRVVSNQASAYYDERVREGLLSHPSICLAMDLDDLFDPATGIYTNSQAHGDQWERPTSVEIIHPSGDRGIQANAGIRMMGNASRAPTRPMPAANTAR